MPEYFSICLCSRLYSGSLPFQRVFSLFPRVKVNGRCWMFVLATQGCMTMAPSVYSDVTCVLFKQIYSIILACCRFRFFTWNISFCPVDRLPEAVHDLSTVQIEGSTHVRLYCLCLSSMNLIPEVPYSLWIQCIEFTNEEKPLHAHLTYTRWVYVSYKRILLVTSWNQSGSLWSMKWGRVLHDRLRWEGKSGRATPSESHLCSPH